jgi:hypothetical protein
MKTAQLPSIGCIVHFVLPEGSPRKGEHRAALITGAWPGVPNANLNVYFDQNDDLAEAKTFHVQGRVWSAPYDESGAPGTWHWPEREEPIKAPTEQPPAAEATTAK